MIFRFLTEQTDIMLHNIYREIYNNSNPSGDWDSLYKEHIEKNTNFWERYYCLKTFQKRIIYSELQKHKYLSRSSKCFLTELITRNYSPNDRRKRI